MWQGFWDFVFVLANTLLAIVFGARGGQYGPRGSARFRRHVFDGLFY